MMIGPNQIFGEGEKTNVIHFTVTRQLADNRENTKLEEIRQNEEIQLLPVVTVIHLDLKPQTQSLRIILWELPHCRSLSSNTYPKNP